MKRNFVLTLLALVSTASLAAPAEAASPFGSFGGQSGGGNGGAGVIPLQGWALDDDGILSVDILVDGAVAGRANLGRSRPGVAASFPGFPDSAHAGFAFQLDTTRYLNGLHTVTARVKSKSGEVVTLNSRTFEFLNTTHNLAPFGAIDFPNPNAEMFGTCDILNPNRRFSVVTGYALDAGVQHDDTGVGYVELLLDRSLLYNSKTSCFFSPVTGGQTNCYGLRRLDVERFFPGLPDSVHSGFRYVLDIGELIAFGYTPGHHTLSVRAGDLFGTVRNIAEMQVTFTCADDVADDLSFGFIDLPLDGRLYSGTVTTFGWALDFNGIFFITVLVDGKIVGPATLGIPRPGVTSLYPGFPESAAPGWQFALDTTRLSNGEHFLQVIVTDDRGIETLIGERRFVVANPRP
jgi:N-acetylmuramoyl-L-alanine amidase